MVITVIVVPKIDIFAFSTGRSNIIALDLRGHDGQLPSSRHALEEQSWNTPETSVELLIFISAPVRTNFHYEVYAPVITEHTFFGLCNGVFPSGVIYICRYVFSQVSLSRDDVVFAVLEVPVSPEFLIPCTRRFVIRT